VREPGKGNTKDIKACNMTTIKRGGMGEREVHRDQRGEEGGLNGENRRMFGDILMLM